MYLPRAAVNRIKKNHVRCLSIHKKKGEKFEEKQKRGEEDANKEGNKEER